MHQEIHRSWRRSVPLQFGYGSLPFFACTLLGRAFFLTSVPRPFLLFPDSVSMHAPSSAVGPSLQGDLRRCHIVSRMKGVGNGRW